MSTDNPMCGVELRNAFTAYLDELTVQMKATDLPPDLYKDWLRYRLDRLKATKVANLTPGQAALLYQHMQAAFPLVTVPLDNANLPVAPVPFQAPMPSFTGEMASIVQNRLYAILGPTALTEQQIMEVVNGAVIAVQAGVASRTGELIELDRLPPGHVILEQADGTETTGMVHQTVRIMATGQEYERVVHADEAYPAEGAPEQERFWTVIGQDGTIHPEYMAANKADVKKPAKELEDEGSRIGLVEFREVPHG